MIYSKSNMVTFDEYIKDILNQIKMSYHLLKELKDNPGDLEIIRKEWLKVNSLLRSITKRIENSDNSRDVFQDIIKKSKHYIDNYYFDREIQIMSGLYSNDTHRIKNIRLKILESFEDNKFIDSIDSTIAKL